MSSARAPILGAWSRRTLAALAEVVLPGPASGAPPMDGARVADFVDEFVFHMPTLLRLLFPIGLALLDLGAFVAGPSLVPFSFMRSPERRRRYIARWVHSPVMLFRELIKGVKGVVLFGYYSDPRVAAHIGYDPEPFARLVATERLRRHGHDLH